MSTGVSLNKQSGDNEHDALLSIKAKMTEQQRQEMAELVQNELVRREIQKKETGMSAKINSKSMVPTSRMSSGLSGADLDDMYRSQDKEIQAAQT